MHPLCADIDFGTYEANTVSGKIGIKVWIFKKTHFAKSPKEILNELRKHREMQEGSSVEGVKEEVITAAKNLIKPEAKETAKKAPAKKATAAKKTTAKKAVAKKEDVKKDETK